MLYIASEQPVPRVLWREAEPAFHVSDLAEDEQRVLAQFSKRFVAYLGAHTGCSCGFCREEEGDSQAERSLEDLRSYLRSVTMQLGSVEMFQCWDGDQLAAPGERHTLTPDDLTPELVCYVDPPWFATVNPD